MDRVLGGVIGFGILGSAVFGVPGAFGGMLLGGLLQWWFGRE